jgi:hypothetical protein
MINTISNLESAASIRETLNQMVAIVNYYSASQFGGSTTTTTQSPSPSPSTTTTTMYNPGGQSTTTTTLGPGQTTTSTTQNFGPSTTTTTSGGGSTSTTTSGVITITVWDGTSGTNAGGVTTSQMACGTINAGYSHTAYLQPGQLHQYNGQPQPGDALFNDVAKTMALPANYYGYYFVASGQGQYLQVGSNGVIQLRNNC